MKTYEELRQYKRAMRKRRAPESEKIFRRRLQNAKIHHVWQCVIGFYIADFVIPHRMVIIELDGSSHVGRETYDHRRDKFLRALGFKVWRIPNADATTVSLDKLVAYHQDTTKRFRSALGKANAERSKAIRREREKAEDELILSRLRNELRDMERL